MESKKEVKATMAQSTHSRLLRFLQEDLAIPKASTSMALRHLEKDQGPLPMILWKYGLVTLEQLDQIYDWLDA